MRDCAQGGQTGCLLIAWPGMQTNAAHSWGGEQADIDVWYGGLVDGMRDASGHMYMRNRYYDPATGQFTQNGPHRHRGRAERVRVCGRRSVSYSDPYGLSAETCCPQWLVDGAAGFGDALSFGLTGVIRRNTPGSDGVNYESGAYAGVPQPALRSELPLEQELPQMPAGVPQSFPGQRGHGKRELRAKPPSRSLEIPFGYHRQRGRLHTEFLTA